MKNLKLFALSIMLLCVSQTSFSQLIFGGKTGLNLSSLASDNADELKSKLGVDIALFAEYGFSDKLAFQLAIASNNKGAKFEEEDVKIKMALEYIEIQPSLIYKHKVENLTLFASAGPYYAPYAFGMMRANKKIFSDGDSKTESIPMGSKSTDSFKTTDYGANFSFGIEDKTFGRFGIQYELGLSNISNSDNSEVKNRSISLFFTTNPFVFGKKK